MGRMHVTFLASCRGSAGAAWVGAARRGGADGRGATGFSLIVSDRNAAALRLYRAFGFAEAPAPLQGGLAVGDEGLGADAQAGAAEGFKSAARARYIRWWRVLAFP